jgi:hypothetical protein
MKQLFFAGAILLSLGTPQLAVANDPWEFNNNNTVGNDDGFFSTNELVDGSVQVHDLQAHNTGPDQDWFQVGMAPYSSYEVIADGLTAELWAPGLDLDLVDGSGTVILSSVEFSSHGIARSLRFLNATATETSLSNVRVTSGGPCTPACSSGAQYRIQFYETTCLIPRFNNNATQVTILVIQNGGRDMVAGTARFWDSAGTLLASQGFSLPPKGAFVVNTSTIAGLAGQSGSITIDHDGRYGSLSGKAVAVEPATGFTFDTAMTVRPH